MDKISNIIDKKDKNNEKTILQHMEIIIEAIQKNSFTDDFYSTYHLHLQSIAKTYDLNLTQALFFTICINFSLKSSISIRDIEKFLNWNTIKIFGSIKDIQVLINKHLIRYSYSDTIYEYEVPRDVMLAVQQNTAYTPKSMENLSIFEYFDRLQEIFNDADNKIINAIQLEIEVNALEMYNQKLPFNQKINKDFYINFDSKLLFLYFCHQLINEENNKIEIHDFEKIFCSDTYRRIKKSLQKNENLLIIYNLIENTRDDFWRDRNFYCLTKHAKNRFLKEFNLEETKTTINKDIKPYQKIVFKQMFYNPEEQKHIDTLTHLISPNAFSQVQERLSKRGMRKGLTILFYGETGTGKTETSFQLAKQCKRDILQVNISETKSCWYGESEKIIHEIFETYRNLLSTHSTPPILLFNEADAIISKRKNITNSNLTQTENAIQNILLQELEDFEGIFIATTNLINNIDDAFERRFLYKIKFEKPCLQAKKSIWESMLKTSLKNKKLLRVSQNYIEQLSEKYYFSGGQIENIIRKMIIDSMIQNTSLTPDCIEQYCKQERWNKQNTKKIGFR